MKPPARPLFLARQTYRRRRMMDLSRMLPLVGLFLFLMPLLWRGSGTAGTGLYLFAVWLGLIVLAVLPARRLSLPAPPGEEGEEPGEEAP